jgi:TRAP transporter TAXI family solute receptor
MRRRSIVSSGILLVCAVLATSCHRGPDEPDLHTGLQKRLDVGFEEGLFAIRSFERTGSAPFRDAERNVSGVFVYYDSQLEFLRDYSLTSWKGLNLGTLAFALGATRQGIEGFDPHGNRAGDVLRVYGRLSYEEADGGWQPLDDIAPAEAALEMRPARLEGSGPEAVLRAVRGLLEREPGPARGSRDATIVRELRRSTTRMDLRFAQLEGRLTIGTAEAPGTYREFGAAFARYATERGLPLHDHASEGSVINGIDVHAMLLDFALVQSDVAEILFEGWTEEDQTARPNLRSLASLWPEALHVVTMEGSDIERLDQLRGKRIAVGHPGSGSRFSTMRIAVAAGLNRSDLAEIRQLGLAESIAALEAGEVDVLFAVEAVPSLALQALTQRRRDTRFVEIDTSVVAALSERHFAYYPLTIPAKSYPGQTEPFQTLAMAAVLVTNRLTPDEQVESLLELVLDSTEALSKVFYRAGFISSETVRLGIALPLHPAAERVYARRAREKSEEPDATEESRTQTPADPD